MRRISAFLLPLSLLISSIAATQDLGPGERYLVKSLKDEAVKRVQVVTAGGSISMTGVDAADQARVEVYIKSASTKRSLSRVEIDEILREAYKFELTVAGGELVAKAGKKQDKVNEKNALAISFQIFVPHVAASDLVTSGGSIQLKDLSGEQSFVTSGGSLFLSGMSGKVSGATSGGSIRIENSNSRQVGLSTSGGSIEARNCEGRLELSTSGGSIKLEMLKGTIKAMTSGGSIEGKEIAGELSASTSGGSIRFDQLACSLETATNGGSIQVAVREITGPLHLSNSAGRISLVLPKEAKADLDLRGDFIRTESLNNFSGTTAKGQIIGKLNGGGFLINAKTSSGDISVEFR